MNTIPDYRKPQAYIKQELETADSAPLDRFHAVVVGPAFQHTTDETLYWESFSSGTLDYQDVESVLPVGPIDLDFVQLQARDLQLELWAAPQVFKTPATNPAGDRLMLASDLTFYSTASSTPAVNFDLGRPPTIGDIYVMTSGADTITRTVVGIEGKHMPANKGAYSFFGVDDLGAGEALLDSLDASDYTYDNSVKRLTGTLTFEVMDNITGVVTLRVTSSAGYFAPFEITGDEGTVHTFAYDGATISVTFPVEFQTAAPVVGRRFSVVIHAPYVSAVEFDKVILNAPVGTLSAPTNISTLARRPFTGAVDPVASDLSVNYVAGANDVTLTQILAPVAGYASDDLREANEGVGQVALKWRAFIPSQETDTVFPISRRQDILTTVGSEHIDSELGFGLLNALRGSEGKRVYGLNTGGATAEDFAQAYDKLELVRYIYSLGILTTDLEIMQAAVAHVREQSADSEKRFRRVYVGTDSPGSFIRREYADDNQLINGEISAGNDGLFNLLTVSDVDLSTFTIREGDWIELPGSGATYTIARVTGPDTLILSQAATAPVALTTVRFWAADSPANTADFVQERSAALGDGDDEDRRVANIWTDKGRQNGLLVPNRFAACFAAGVRSVKQPHQGLTRHEFTPVFDAIPPLYTKFKRALLDQMASHGVWIITQDGPGLPTYVRHQLTTSVVGPLYFEDSAGTNIDDVCFRVDDVIEPKIGKINVTERSLVAVKNEIIEVLSSLTETDFQPEIDEVISGGLGPQLAAFYSLEGDEGTISISIDSNFKDQFNIGFIVDVPLPFNVARILVRGQTLRLSPSAAPNFTFTTELVS